MKVTFKSPSQEEINAGAFDLQLFAEDEPMSAEELEEIFNDDPDLRLAVEDDEDEDDELDEEGELDEEDELKSKRAAKKRRQERPAAIDPETQRIIDDIRTNPDKYTREPVRPPIDAPERRTEEPKTETLDIAAVAKAFAADMVTDPEKAGVKLIGTMLKLQKQSEDRVRNETRREFDGVANQTATQAVRAAMSEFDDHPAMTPEVKKEFKVLVAKAVERGGKAIANMKPEEISSGMRAALAEAIGNVALGASEKRKRVSTAAPTYAPRHGSGSRPEGRATPQLSAVERDVIRNMREAGITDAKTLKQTIREMRREAAEEAS